MDGATTRSRRKQQLALPTELWRIIILESLPKQNSFHTSLPRQRALSRYSRISTGFRWVQEELFREIHVEKWERSVRLLSALRQHDKSKKLGQLVKVLRVGNEFESLGQDEQGDHYDLIDLLRYFTNLEQLFVGRIRNAQSLALFQSPPLRALHIWDSNFHLNYCIPQTLLDSTPCSALDSLRHLTFLDSKLNHPPFRRDVSKYFPFDRTPNLTALFNDHSPPSSLTALISYAGTQSLNSPIEHPILFFSTHSNHLIPSTDEQPLSYLPSSLRFLRVTSGHFFGSDYLTPYFLSHPRSLPNLEELILPMRLRAAGAFENLREWAKARGVRIAWEKDEESPGTVWDKGFWEVVERVEEIVEREKRELQKKE